MLADFIASGVYDISDRAFVTTPSPSMDILVSSNLERLLFDLADADRVVEWMRSLAADRRFQVDRQTFAKMREVFLGDFVTNDESLSTIRRVWNEQGYLLDPHTAVAWEVAERLRGDNPVVVVSTAHWAKFGADVYKALRGLPYAGPLPAEVAACTGVELLAKVPEMAPEGACVPRALAELESRGAPQLIIYLAGADAHENDRLGKLALTFEGMRARDERVFDFAERLGVPIVVTMAGGYGRDIDVTVALHFQTIGLALRAWRRRAQLQQAGIGA